LNSHERMGRQHGHCWIAVVNRHTLRQEASIEVGPYGNTCDLLLLDDWDLVDRASEMIAWRQKLAGTLHKSLKPLATVGRWLSASLDSKS
jgi:hypothetical protein